MMKACVTKRAACDYTLLGHHKTKKNFSSLPIYRVIMRKYFLYFFPLMVFYHV